MTRPASPPAAVKGPIRLGAARRMMVYLIGVGVWASGGVWLVFHYFLRRAGEFGPETHPLEPWWLRLHGAFAFAAIWLAGLLWASHIVNGWGARRRRWSGSLMLSLVALLTLTGWLLYYGGDDALRRYSSFLHWIVGLGAPALFVWHRYVAEKLRAPRARAQPKPKPAPEAAPALMEMTGTPPRSVVGAERPPSGRHPACS